MTDLVAIGEFVGSMRGVADLTKTILGLHDTSAIKGKIAELQTHILSAQSSALEAQADQLALLQRVSALEKEIASLEEWDAQKARYDLKDVSQHQYRHSASCFAYVLKDEADGSEPPHWICASCYEQRRKSILQNAPFQQQMQKSVTCPLCKSTLVGVV